MSDKSKPTLPWPECVRALSDTRLRAEFQDWRNFSPEFCQWARAQNLFGYCYGLPALPVFDRQGNFLAEHYFTKKKTGPKAFYTQGVRKLPFVVGNLKLAREIHLFESTWDPLAVADATG